MHADLASHAGLTAFGQTISDRIRAESHEEAEVLLRSALGDYPSPAADLALALAASSVRVTGWSALNARIEALSASTQPITAIWLHLSNYTDDAADGLRHPAVEIGYLRDGDVAFSRESTAALLAASARYPAPWTGAPDEDGQEVTVAGLERLNDWLVKFEPGPGTGAEAARLTTSIALAEWFRTLRWHQAIHAALAAKGLVRDIPVIVGSHGAGPWCCAIYRRARAFRVAPRGQPDARARAKLQDEIAYQIGAWENVRAGLEMTYGGFGARGYDAAAREVRHMAERWFPGTPFEGEYPLEMSKPDFERFLQRWRHYRDPEHFEAPQPAAPIIRPGLGRLFGRKGL